MVQVHVPARVWGFESLLRHHFLVLNNLPPWCPPWCPSVHICANFIKDGQSRHAAPRRQRSRPSKSMPAEPESKLRYLKSLRQFRREVKSVYLFSSVPGRGFVMRFLRLRPRPMPFAKELVATFRIYILQFFDSILRLLALPASSAKIIPPENYFALER